MGSLGSLALFGDREVVISKHADRRIGERLGETDLDRVRGEIEEAFSSGRWLHRAREIYYCYSESFAGFYVVALRPRVIVVITVCRTEPLVAA